jgi:hypothetical protein
MRNYKILLSLMFSCMFTTLVGILLATHLFLLLKNKTTIESMKFKWFLVIEGQKVVIPGTRSIFDNGWKQNINEIFGSGYWAFPINRTLFESSINKSILLQQILVEC